MLRFDRLSWEVDNTVRKNKVIILAVLVVGVISLLSACGSGNEEPTSSEASYPNAYLLADVEWVSEHLEDSDLVIIDSRSQGFEEGHIPGAVNLSSGKINDVENEINGFLLDEEPFGELLSSLGVNQDSNIVVYDDGNALSATRIFYALEYYGLKDQVKVLNGGYPAWLIAGHDISVDPVQPAAGNFVAKANANLVSSKDQVLEQLDHEDVVLLDTRSADEYSGAEKRDNLHGGHIPGAVHLDWTAALTENEEGLQQFLSFEELQENFDSVGVEKDKTIITYCQTNVRGAHSYFSLRLLGYEDIRPYEGSWAEWGNSEDTPIVN